MEHESTTEQIDRLSRETYDALEHLAGDGGEDLRTTLLFVCNQVFTAFSLLARKIDRVEENDRDTFDALERLEQRAWRERNRD